MSKKIRIIIQNVMIIFIITSSITIIHPIKVEAANPFLTLVAKTNGGGVRPDYLNFLKQHVAKIGINLQVVVQDWPTFVGELIVYRDFDICYVGLTGGGADPDFTGIYNENGSLNLFGYDETMDWDPTLTLGNRTGWGLNEWYMKKGTLIMPPNSEERITHYWEWEDYMMDKICPLLPTFVPKSYMAQWSNLQGYNYSKGILQSWGKMTFDGLHQGQQNSNELVKTGLTWEENHPFAECDCYSKDIANFILEPLFWIDADTSIWPHLAKGFTMINDTHVRIITREGIKWQTDPEGLFPNEYFDAEDVYFTLYCWKHISNDPLIFNWLEDVKLINETYLDVFIDGNLKTVVNDPYYGFLAALSTTIAPEHYLNQTQLADGKTPNILDPYWEKYVKHNFGTGLFELGDSNPSVETELEIYENCWWLNPSITNDSKLNWEERFGFANGFTPMNNLRIRAIFDIQTELSEFEAGKLDIVGITAYPDKKDEYAAQPEKFEIQSDTLFSYGFFGYNMREVRGVIGECDPCPGDPTISIGLAVRKAISYACNRVEINNVIHRGEYIITDWPIYPKMGIWCNHDIIRYNFDLDRARDYAILINGFCCPTSPTDNTELRITALGYLISLIATLLLYFFSKRISRKNN